jgi:S-adenosylmethionine hydrolase
VGQMKGIALGINPQVQLIDLTHEIPPHQILRAAYVWNDALDAFSTQTIHMAIVDPGVGSDRGLVAAEIGPYRLVCPDNGVLSVILQREPIHRIVILDNPRWWRTGMSNTFHGRDILTPVASAWSLGHDLLEFGSPLTTPLVTVATPNSTKGKTSVSGQVIHVDHFGNLVTSISAKELPARMSSFKFQIGAFQIESLSRYYADVAVGEPLALIGSSGRLEISVRNGNAADEFQVECGRRVSVRWEGHLRD